MVTATARRVSANTNGQVNRRIQEETEARVAGLAKLGSAHIEKRLRELDREWDVERCIETVAPSLTLLGLAAGFFRARRWFLVPIAVQSFLLQHAVQGWCPPLPVLRNLGIRTVQEIEHERNALLALRRKH
jgi:hypothetical protein